MTATAPAPAQRTIQSVDRAAMLIKAIADSRQPPTVVELAAACGLNRSTAWRLLATLDAHGLIERDPVSQRYSLGYAFLRIAAGAEPDPLVRQARPVLERLAIATGEATNLAVVKRFRLVYVDQVDPPQIMAPNWFGRDVPLHATSTGKAYLAFMTPEERQTALPGAARAVHRDDGHRPQGARGGARGSPPHRATRRASASSRSRSSARRLPCSPSRAGRSRS